MRLTALLKELSPLGSNISHECRPSSCVNVPTYLQSKLIWLKEMKRSRVWESIADNQESIVDKQIKDLALCQWTWGFRTRIHRSRSHYWFVSHVVALLLYLAPILHCKHLSSNCAVDGIGDCHNFNAWHFLWKVFRPLEVKHIHKW